MKYIILVVILAIVILVAMLSLTVYRDRIKATFYIDHMEREERTSRMHIDRILDTLNIRKGDKIADVGAGSGLFSRKMAERAGSGGKVYAIDINPDLLSHIERDIAARGIGNIQTVLSVESDPKIPEPVDLVFICDTLHYVDKQPEFVKKMSAGTRASGRIAVISFFKNWPPMSKKFTAEELTSWMKAAGLILEGRHDFIQDEFLMIFRKK